MSSTRQLGTVCDFARHLYCVVLITGHKAYQSMRLDSGCPLHPSHDFADPDGAILRKIRSQKIFMFGSEVSVRTWRDKPLLRQCARCYKLDHSTARCPKSKDLCVECGSSTHLSSEHRARCAQCKGLEAHIECTHQKCCNCGGSHRSDSADCPERRKYRSPVSEPTHNLENAMNTSA
jgi:hypothetical protein